MPHARDQTRLRNAKVLLLLLLASVSACASLPDTQSPSAQPARHQIIIAFVNATLQPTPALDRSLSETAGVPLRPLRPLGKAQLYGIDNSLVPEQLERVLDKLNARPDIRYAELDRRVNTYR